MKKYGKIICIINKYVKIFFFEYKVLHMSSFQNPERKRRKTNVISTEKYTKMGVSVVK